MSKWQFLWRPDPGEGRAAFTRRALELVPQRLQALGARDVWLHVTEEAPPLLSVIPLRRQVLALVSIQGQPSDLGLLAGESLAQAGGHWAGYLVTEAQPVPRSCTWPLGARAPGACLLTLFRRRPGLSREHFLERWHHGHTPLSLEIHPLESYVRNTVETPLASGAPPWEGIVTESFPSRAHLVNPLLLFGGTRRAPLNMLRVGWDIASFMDLLSMQCYLVTEYPLPERQTP